MSRSWSDPVVPLDREYDDHRHHYYELKKRQLDNLQSLDFIDDHYIARGGKRPRQNIKDFYILAEDSPPPPEFFIIKENSPSSSAITPAMTRGQPTPYGDPILRQNDTSPTAYIDNQAFFRVKGNECEQPCTSIDQHEEFKDHDAAAHRVEAAIKDHRIRKRFSQHERILKSLISPRSEFKIDDTALESILSAANELFFQGRLKGRVEWLWKDLEENLLGTTGWREAPADRGGYETLIFLSNQVFRPEGRPNRYNRRLLISTFIHELIHCYLFVDCGYHPDGCGGHTSGFKRIAALINNWVGEDSLLQLHKIEAELSDFEIRTSHSEEGAVITTPTEYPQIFSGCRVQMLDDGTLGFIDLRPGLRL